MIYCFDIDGTLCTNTDGAYEDALPFPDVIARVNGLYDDEHQILLYTARGATTGVDWKEVTKAQLAAWGVRYHALFLGKPTADVYIDDRAVNSADWLRTKPASTVEAVGTGDRADVRLVWMNGALVPEHDARLSIYDSALMFGDMVFEMTRSFNRRQFKLRVHLERLFASIKVLRIPMPLTVDQLEAAVYETIAANNDFFAPDDEHRLMIDVSRGLLSIYEPVIGIPSGPNVIIAVFPLRWTVAGMSRLFDTGINAVIPSQRAIPASLLDPKVKNRSRLHYQMANIEVSGYEGDRNWALLLDPDGFVAEGTGDNFFIVRGDTLITPEGRNVLRGISRAYVMEELAESLGLRVIEANFDRYDVLTADEAFMTGTPFCLLPVTSLDGVSIGDGRVGSVVKSLLDAWSANVGVDIVGQMTAWDATSRVSTGPSPYSFRGSK